MEDVRCQDVSCSSVLEQGAERQVQGLGNPAAASPKAAEVAPAEKSGSMRIKIVEKLKILSADKIVVAPTKEIMTVSIQAFKGKKKVDETKIGFEDFRRWLDFLFALEDLLREAGFTVDWWSKKAFFIASRICGDSIPAKR
jgi:hypothetical protein